MSLFIKGPFMSKNGLDLPHKIECDALTTEDWQAIAASIYKILPPFKAVFGVPRGGLDFANALWSYRLKDAQLVLVVDDVMTTGKSILEMMDWFSSGPVMGLVLFSRMDDPPLDVRVVYEEQKWVRRTLTGEERYERSLIRK